MSRRRVLNLASAIGCVACLAGGFVWSAQWAGLAGVLLAAAAWLPACRRQSGAWPAVALALSTGVAAAGLIAGAAPLPMLLGSTLALAGWDLALLNRALPDEAATNTRAAALFESRHYASLAVALGPALLIAAGGRLLRIDLPLGVIALLVVLVLYGLDRAWRGVLGARDTQSRRS